MTETPEYARRLVFRDGEVEALADRLHHITEELAAGTLTAPYPGARDLVCRVRDSIEYATGCLHDIAVLAGVGPGSQTPEGGTHGYGGGAGSGAVGKTGPMDPDQVPDPAEVARMLRAVLDDVADDPDLTAHPAWRHRVEGAVLLLDLLSGNDRLRTSSEPGSSSRSEA